MSVKCVKCGTELPDGVAFCTECGTKVEKPEPAPQPEPQPEPASQPTPEPRTAPQPAPEVKAAPVYTEEPVGFFPYFGLMALFALPFVGFICSIIFSFAPKKKSLKSFARAQLVWTLIGAVLSVILVIIGLIIGKSIVDGISSSFGSLTDGGIPDLKGLLDEIMSQLPME